MPIVTSNTQRTNRLPQIETDAEESGIQSKVRAARIAGIQTDAGRRSDLQPSREPVVPSEIGRTRGDARGLENVALSAPTRPAS